MELSVKIIRWILIVWNLLLALGAVLSFILGVHWLYGVCYLVFAAIGFWGALRKQHCLLYTYVVVGLCLLVVELGWVVYMWRNYPQMKAEADLDMQHIYYNYTTDASAKTRVDTFQKMMECCGSTSPTEPWTTLGVSPPASCYTDTDKVDHTPEAQKPHAEACISQSMSFMGLYEFDPGESLTSIVVLVVTVVLSLLLLRSLRRDQLSRMSDGGEMPRL